VQEARDDVSNAVSEWKKVMLFVERVGKANSAAFSAADAAALEAAIVNPDPLAQDAVHELRTKLWRAALVALARVLKDARWMSEADRRRTHDMASLRVRTEEKWLAARKKFYKSHGGDAQATADMLQTIQYVLWTSRVFICLLLLCF
jgi:hypothetical protein